MKSSGTKKPTEMPPIYKFLNLFKKNIDLKNVVLNKYEYQKEPKKNTNLDYVLIYTH